MSSEERKGRIVVTVIRTRVAWEERYQSGKGWTLLCYDGVGCVGQE